MGGEFGGGWIEVQVIGLEPFRSSPERQYNIKTLSTILKTLKGEQTRHGDVQEVGSGGEKEERMSPWPAQGVGGKDLGEACCLKGGEFGGQRPRACLGWTGLYWDSTGIISGHITWAVPYASPLLQGLSTKVSAQKQSWMKSERWNGNAFREGTLSHS